MLEYYWYQESIVGTSSTVQRNIVLVYIHMHIRLEHVTAVTYTWHTASRPRSNMLAHILVFPLLEGDWRFRPWRIIPA